MDKEKATQLLESARADHETWVYYTEVNHAGEMDWWQITTPPSSRLDVVCSKERDPVTPRGNLLAAAPELARWGIELAEEVERLRAELATIRARVGRPMTFGDRVHLAPIGGGEPTVVEYSGHVRGYAVVVDADRTTFMVASERVSPLPPEVATQTLPSDGDP